MRISHRYKFVFIAIPRTGSTAVRSALTPFSDVLGGADFPFYYHVTAKELKETFRQKGWDWDEYYKFTFVRDPFERIYSQYRFYCGQHDILPLPKYSDFAHWVQSSEEDYKAFLFRFRLELLRLFSTKKKAEIKAHIEHLERVWEPASTWLFDDHGKLLLDYVGRYESLYSDFKMISNKIGLPDVDLIYEDLAYDIVRPSLSDYQKIYDEPLKKIVREKFKSDFENLNY